jgi:hydrogenase-4 component F
VTDALVVAALAVPALTAALAWTSERHGDGVNRLGALLTTAALTALAVEAAIQPGPALGGWAFIDGASVAYLAIAGWVGCAAALLSPAYLSHHESGFFRGWSRRSYYAALHLFWATVVLVAIAANLATAWIAIEASTATSALLVVFTGRHEALEAGWKYLVLTSAGLTVALLGIVLLYAGGPAPHDISQLDWTEISASASRLPHELALTSFLLVAGGLAAKVGWAPVHQWLPDAHAEAPAPVSALLSGVLLPTVMLVVWRVGAAVSAGAGAAGVRAIFLCFGVLSLAVSIPFLWRRQPLKRLLAYSSLEHMGVVAIGIGFGTPLALAGVLVHIAGHAIAKSLAFFAAGHALVIDPSAARRPAIGLARSSSGTATVLGLALLALAGLPPSPLFLSEALILVGGFATPAWWVAALAALLLALAFIGVLGALLDALGGRPRARARARLAEEAGA